MNFSEQRIKLNNSWPNRWNFPIEDDFIKLLKKENISQVFVPVELSFSDNTEFQIFLSHFLDSLDMLPMRPDLAFENIWKIIDKESNIIKSELNDGNTDKFELLFNKVFNSDLTANTFIKYLDIIPLQTCKYAAKRLIEANISADRDQITYLKKVKTVLNNESFFEKFFIKYTLSLSDADLQRKAGRLLMKVFKGEEITLDGEKFQFSNKVLSRFLVRSVLVNIRNERSHGSIFPSFRSSKASLKSYKHAYFLYHIAYTLLLDIFLYKNDYSVLLKKDVEENTIRNTELFKVIFSTIDK